MAENPSHLSLTKDIESAQNPGLQSENPSIKNYVPSMSTIEKDISPNSSQEIEPIPPSIPILKILFP